MKSTASPNLSAELVENPSQFSGLVALNAVTRSVDHDDLRGRLPTLKFRDVFVVDDWRQTALN